MAHAGLIAILNVIDCQTVSVILKSVKSRFNIVILTSWKWRDIGTWTINFFFPPVYTLLIQFNDRREIYSKVYMESEHKATFHSAVRCDAFIKKGIIQIIYWYFIGSTTHSTFQKVHHIWLHEIVCIWTDSFSMTVRQSFVFKKNVYLSTCYILRRA